MKALVLVLTSVILLSQSALAATLGCAVTVGGANFGPESKSLNDVAVGQTKEAYFNNNTTRVAITYTLDNGIKVVANVFDTVAKGYVQILDSSSGAYQVQNPYLQLNSTLGTGNGAVSVNCALMTPSAP